MKWEAGNGQKKPSNSFSFANKPLHIFAVSQTSYGWANLCPDGIATPDRNHIALQPAIRQSNTREDWRIGAWASQRWTNLAAGRALWHFATFCDSPPLGNQNQKFQHGSGNGKRTNSYKFVTLLLHSLECSQAFLHSSLPSINRNLGFASLG